MRNHRWGTQAGALLHHSLIVARNIWRGLKSVPSIPGTFPQCHTRYVPDGLFMAGVSIYLGQALAQYDTMRLYFAA